MGKALTLQELRELIWQNDIGTHIWVEVKENECVYAGIADMIDNEVVAMWCVGSEDDWLREETYGTEWRAYLEKPELSDRCNFPGAHLNGMEGYALEDLLNKLKGYSDAYKALFQPPYDEHWTSEKFGEAPTLPLVWTVDAFGMLYLDGIWVCLVKYIAVEKLEPRAHAAGFLLPLMDGWISIVIIKEFGKYKIVAMERTF